MKREETLYKNLDWSLLIVLFLLLIMGVATVYSAAYNEKHPNLFDFSQKYGKQVLWVIFSCFLGFLVFLIDSSIYRKFAIPIYIFCILLLVIVLFMPSVNGAHAWLGIGNLGIQPAEFTKIGTAIALGSYLNKWNPKMQNSKTVIISNLILLVPMGLILLQPDAGTFVVFTSFLFVLYREGVTYDPLILSFVNLLPKVKFKETWIGTHFIPISFVLIVLSLTTLVLSRNLISLPFFPNVFISGVWGVIVFLFLLSLIFLWILRRISAKRERKKVNIIVLLGFILCCSLSITVNYGFESLASHQKERIELFLGLKEDPDGEDYNRNRAMAAVGSGALTGKGYKNASVASVEANHVPESETDFIFCPFAEEWGFVGSALLIALYLFLLLRIIFLAERQKSTFNRVYAYCTAMILFYHFAINIGMNIGFAPVIGIPLPFFSYGGSSLMSFTVMVFILLKLDSQRNDMLI
ncbi:MAG: rod shape-determining protein RodA [Flavobacteriia bacterium]|nr:rod shape-determining protein RodA [Flavobacteriia bacterium]